MAIDTVLNSKITLRINAKQFRGGLVFEAHRLSYHSTLVSRTILKKECGAYENMLGRAVRLVLLLG